MERIRKLLSLLLILALCFTFIPIANVQAASKVKINKTSTTIYVGKTETLKISGTSKTVKWSTSNKNIATVSSKGKVTAKKAGTAIITAKVSGKSYKCKVTVKNPSLNKSKATLEEGKTITLKLTGATAKKYTSSNKNVANVNGKGKITAKKAGTATITCTGSNKKTYKCKITVTEKTAPYIPHEHSYTLSEVKQATCIADGLETYTCSCGDSYTKTNKATGHNWDEGKITTEPTCTTEGVKTFTCNNCGEIKTETIEKTDHNYQWKTNGNTRTLKCSCGATGITEECVAGVWGYFDYGAAQELFSWVNNTRAEATYTVQDAFGHTIGIATVPALTNFDGLYSIAKQRAAELATNFSHNLKTDNENIARGCESAQACYEAWCYSRDHASTMTNPIYTQGSCAVFYYDADGSGQNLYPVYVLVVNK